MLKNLDEIFIQTNMMTCKHCGQTIEKIIDPWGYDNYRGMKYGYYHPDLVDVGCSGTACRDGETGAELSGL